MCERSAPNPFSACPSSNRQGLSPHCISRTTRLRAPSLRTVAVLEMLASQAAISLENATRFSDLQRSEAYLTQGQSISHTGSFGWNVSSGEIYWSEETYNIFEYERTVKPTLELILQRIHPDDRDLVQQTIDRAVEARANLDFEHRLLMEDGSVKHVHVAARALSAESGSVEFVGTVMDVTERTRSEEALPQMQADLAHISRVTTMGELTVSLAHEIKQPIAAAVTDANTCLRRLGRDQPPLPGLETGKLYCAYLLSGTMSDGGQWEGCALTLATIATGPSTGLTSTLYPSTSTSGRSPCRSFVAASIEMVEDSPGTSEM